MIELLLSLLLGIHLLAVDVAMAGPLLAVWLRWRGHGARGTLAGARLPA